jgi:hypothetical protein
MKISLTAGTAAAVLVAALFMPTSASAAPAASPSPNDEQSQVFTGSFEVVPEAENATPSAMSTQAICVAVQRVDYPHISTSNPTGPRAVQAHGNWDKGNCNATLADVTTQIDRKNPIGLFQAVGKQGKGRLAPNPKGLTSGGAGRVTARYDCNGTAKAPFRAWTSIDMVGIADTPNKQYSPATESMACG